MEVYSCERLFSIVIGFCVGLKIFFNACLFTEFVLVKCGYQAFLTPPQEFISHVCKSHVSPADV